MLKMSFTQINARMDMSGHGLSHNIKGLWAIAGGVTDIQHKLLKYPFIFNYSLMLADKRTMY